MSNFYKVTDNVDTIFAEDVNQFADAFSGLNDVGSISLFTPITVPNAPTVAINATAGNLNGAYTYKVAFLTGYWKGVVGSGVLNISGNTTGGTVSSSVSPVSQQVNISAIPLGGTGVVARMLYRTKAGGSTYYQVAQISDNTTTTYTDNIADTSLTVVMPVSNTTGTFISASSISDGSVTNTEFQYINSLTSNAQTQITNVKTTADAALPASSYTASDILTKIKTVDGSGSGLDADTLDGYNTSTIATLNTIPVYNASAQLVGNITGNAATVTTNANLTGMVTSVGNTTTVVTNANLTGEVTSVGNAATLTNSAVISKVLTGYVSGAGTISATDSILQAIQKLNANDSTNANLTGMVTSVGNATTVVTNANLTGDVISVGNATTVKTNLALAGSPTTTTQTAGDNSTKIATTAYVALTDNKIGNLSSLTTLDKTSLVNSHNEETSRRKDLGINVKDYYASGSLQSTTGSITSGSNSLTLASALDFQNGQGINVNGIKEVASLSVTAGATSSSNCTVTLNGVATTVALTSGNTATQVATAIRAKTFSGWTTGGSTTTVTFTSTTTGNKTDATYSAGTTGATGTMTTTTQGTSDLVTTITSGAGTTTLILAANASTTVSGVTVLHDDTSSFQTIEGLTGQVVYLPDGTYIVNGITLTKRYTGIGKIKLNGTIQAGNYVSIQSLPTSGANSTDYFGGDQRKIDSEYFEIATGVPVSTITSNYYNWELQPHLTNFWVNSGYSGMTTKTTGTNSSGQAVVNVRNTTDLSAAMQVLIGSDAYTILTINSSTQFTCTSNLINTYTVGTWVTKGNRTMFDDYFSNLFHLAGGDAYSYLSRVVAGKAPDADQTHFSYNSTAGIIGGDLTATVDGVYMTGSEMNFLDTNYLGSHDIAVVGDVKSFQRTNATGARGAVWIGHLLKSEGTQYAEAAYSALGKWKGGLDLAGCDFGTDKAAIKIANNHRIYFNSSGTADEAGYKLWSGTVGNMFMDYDNASTQFRIWHSGAVTHAFTPTDYYSAGNIHAGATGWIAVNTNNLVYLDGGSNTGLRYNGTNIQLLKAGTVVATW